MPELPEMDTYRTLLSKNIGGQIITGVTVNREKSINVPVDHFIDSLLNKKIIDIKRRGKHLIFILETGKALLLHLMLGGWMYLGNQNDNPDRTKQIILNFGDKELYFIGLRLGYLHLHTLEEIDLELSELGPEPLEPSFLLKSFTSLVENKRGKLKTTLADQKFIAGIGNCYSDEICFEAGLKPMKQMNDLDVLQVKRLYDSIRSVLSASIQFGGYMEQPFMKGDTLTGGFDSKCKVYDRENEPCIRCGNPIVKIEISSRKCFYCTICQVD
ncbi:DNA-formamidopyrimidine glycosylase [Bacillus sp. Marseille-P3661]|uniref:DNA-formamidopyrimidine glycosylase n=1 Tax=Bacillus sp. Marseille-P3661 TaxID=1936234 RepID=UPI000C83A141|nr:DNA-formamidopyrimidine glycosylase [Bacillus sp. Marseille-P3661]